MPPWISTSPAATFGQNVMQSYESKDYDTLEIEGTKCKMHPNTLDVNKLHSKERCFCNWVSRARAVCTSQYYVTICHNMSWYVTMSPAFNRPFLWRVGCTAKGSQWCGRRSLQKSWWCKRVMGPPRNPSSGDKLDIILFPSKKYLGTLPQNMGKNRSWSSNHLHSILIYYIYYTFDVQLFLMHPKSFKSYSRRAV